VEGKEVVSCCRGSASRAQRSGGAGAPTLVGALYPNIPSIPNPAQHLFQGWSASQDALKDAHLIK